MTREEFQHLLQHASLTGMLQDAGDMAYDLMRDIPEDATLSECSANRSHAEDVIVACLELIDTIEAYRTEAFEWAESEAPSFDPVREWGHLQRERL